MSHILGDCFAQLQNSIDTVASWGFGKLKNLGAQNTKKESGKIAKVGRGIAGFLGEMGTEYYKKYEELKQKKNHKQSDSKK
jgi:uncharacterized membrane protein YebE (DUF533 family)